MADTYQIDCVSLNSVLDSIRHEVCKHDCNCDYDNMDYEDWVKGCQWCSVGFLVEEIGKLKVHKVAVDSSCR